MGLDGVDQGDELRAVNETDGFVSGKIYCVAGEFAGGDNYNFFGIFGGHQTEHFVDDRRTDGEHLPLFALHPRDATVAAEGLRLFKTFDVGCSLFPFAIFAFSRG